ncbi:MAG: C2H2-type zinc finger protein [Bacteroidetes bacterium]|nr:C2H2-type zinc finger protein [Bacteroidota bacterium]
MLALPNANRLKDANEAMDRLMAEENLGNPYLGRRELDNILRHVTASGTTLGYFFKGYFERPAAAPTAAPVLELEATTEFKCACNRTFKSLRALGGHKRTCKL